MTQSTLIPHFRKQFPTKTHSKSRRIKALSIPFGPKLKIEENKSQTLHPRIREASSPPPRGPCLATVVGNVRRAVILIPPHVAIVNQGLAGDTYWCSAGTGRRLDVPSPVRQNTPNKHPAILRRYYFVIHCTARLSHPSALLLIQTPLRPLQWTQISQMSAGRRISLDGEKGSFEVNTGVCGRQGYSAVRELDLHQERFVLVFSWFKSNDCERWSCTFHQRNTIANHIPKHSLSKVLRNKFSSDHSRNHLTINNSMDRNTNLNNFAKHELRAV